MVDFASDPMALGHADDIDRIREEFEEVARGGTGRVLLLDGKAALDPDTANPKDLVGALKAPLRLVPPALVISTAPAMALGAAKYGAYNWRKKPITLSAYLEALLRHIYAYMDGEDLDPESGYLHTGHASACLAIIFDAASVGNLIDDRPTPGAAARLLAEQDHRPKEGA